MWLIAALLVAFVSLIPEGSRDVSAVSPSTTTWDTTSDFDNGTKVDTGAKWFAENGIDQPSDWIAFPRSWSFNGRTYTAWQGDTDYKIYIIYYDHIDGVWAAPVVIQGLNPINGDGHGSPAIGITNDGYLHVFCCAHGGEQEYFRSTNPQSIEKWTNKTTAIAIPTSSYP